MSQADDAAGGHATFMRYEQSSEVKKPFLPLRSVNADHGDKELREGRDEMMENIEEMLHAGGPEEGGGPEVSTKREATGQQEAAETLLRSLCEEPYETVFEDPPSGCPLRNLDTGEARPMLSENLTESFVGKLCEPKFHKVRPWKLWWSEKRQKDERLLEAAEDGDADAIRQLLTQPADGGPPAAANAQHRVAKKGRAALHLAVASENLEVVELLLQRGANVNVRSRQRRLTPLHVAAAQGSVDLVEHLLAANADVLCQTDDHQIALHYAAANGHAEVVQVLVHQDSSQLTLRNIFGQRPMEAAANASTAFIFRAFESTASLRKATVSTASTTLGSRRSSVCSDASTATGSSDVMEMKLEETSQDGYAERTGFAAGLLLRNARPDAVQRLLQKTRELEAEIPREKVPVALMTARSWKASSPKDSPTRSPVSSCGSTPKTTGRGPPFARMRRGNSRVEKVGPNSFELVNLLGRGSFGEVFQVKHKRTGKAYAMKVLQKSRIMSSNLLRYAVTERNILAYILLSQRELAAAPNP
eukprot:symbB.v1.2.004772.t1/scaffold274.1/size244435/13